MESAAPEASRYDQVSDLIVVEFSSGASPESLREDDSPVGYEIAMAPSVSLDEYERDDGGRS